jgi:AraC-like DNA-binding protein
MEYQVIPPPPALKNYVRYFWTLDCSCAERSRQVLKLMADRYPRLIVQHLSGHSAIRDPGGELLPGAFLGGVTTRQTAYAIQGFYAHTCVSFYPHGLHRLFGVEAARLTDALPDLAHFCPRRLRESLLLAPSRGERIARLARYLLDQLHARGRDDQALTACLLEGDPVGPPAGVGVLLKKYGWSERQLERKFKMAVGISPATYLRIVRFEKAVDQLRSDRFGKLQDVAFGLNYADHSHFTREFKQFSGYTPKAFLAEQKYSEESASFLVGDENAAG